MDVDSDDDTSIVAVTCEGGLMMAPSRAAIIIALAGHLVASHNTTG